MRIGLVTPKEVSAKANPGSHMITAGIRYLLEQVVPDAEFVPIELLLPWGSNERQIAATCDALVLCGNPRFDTGNDQWLYTDVLDEMLAIGCPVYDLYGGSCTPLGLSGNQQLTALVENERNRDIARRMARCAGVTVRDAMSVQVCRALGIDARLLPCSSWWAADCHGITHTGGDRRVLIPYRYQDIELVNKLAVGREVVTVSQKDYDWYLAEGLDSRLIFDPVRLLELFAESEEVVSFRLHCAIPAASLGCRVLTVAIDTRASAVDLFGMPRSPLMAGMPQPELAIAPVAPIEFLKGMLNA